MNTREEFLAQMQEERRKRLDREKTQARQFKLIAWSGAAFLVSMIAAYFFLEDKTFHMYLALIIGSFFSLAVSVVLFAVLFHSARSGLDDQQNHRKMYEQQLVTAQTAEAQTGEA